MKIEQQISKFYIVTILAILASPLYGKAVHTSAECEALLHQKIAEGIYLKLQQNGADLKTADQSTVRCFEEPGNSATNPRIRAEIVGKKYQFFALDKDDNQRMDAYRRSGLGLDVAHIGTSGDYHVYLCSLEGFEERKLDGLSFKDAKQLKIDVVQKLKGMSANKIYPQASLPESVYYNDKQNRIALISLNDFQKENPQAIHGWLAQLFRNAKEQTPAVVTNPKNTETVKNMREEFAKFVEAPSKDEKFLDNLFERMNKTETAIASIESGKDENFAKENIKAFDEVKKQEEKSVAPAKLIGETGLDNVNTPNTVAPLNNLQSDEKADLLGSNQEQDNLALKGAEEPMQKEKKDLLDKVLLKLEKESEKLKTVGINKDESKKIDKKDAEDKFDYIPYVIGVVIVLGLVTLSGAFLLIRRKRVVTPERSGLMV